MESNFIVLNRKILQHPDWLGQPFDRAKAWIDLLFMANWRDTDFIKRGQIKTTQLYLAKRWGWNRKTVARYISVLKVSQQAGIKTDNKYTYLTIKNYNRYQMPVQQEGQQMSIQRDTTEGHKDIKKKEKVVVADKNSNKRNILLFLNDREFIKEKSDQFNLDMTKVEEEIKLCADWWEESGKKLKHPKAALNNWLRKVNPDYSSQVMKKRIERENKITDLPIIPEEERKRNLKKVAAIKAEFLKKQEQVDKSLTPVI